MSIKSLILGAFLSYGLSLSAATDFFGCQKISFLGTDYNLVWSANTNNSKIEHFIPKGPSYTQFEKKLSVYHLKNVSLEKIFMEKQAELEDGKQDGQILEFKNAVLNKNEIMCSYTSELTQDGAVLVVQFSSFRYLRTGSDVIVFEWQHRAYKEAESFKKKIEKNKKKWLEAFEKFDLSIFKF